MLSPQAISRLSHLQMVTTRRLAGHLTGEHRSTHRGESVDFADFREYNPGDDLRKIDPHVLARFDTLLVRLYEAEEELAMRVLLDTSASMGMYGKCDTALSVAAGLGAVCLTSSDSVTLHRLDRTMPPRRFVGRSDVSALATHLTEVDFGGDTNFVDGVARVLAHHGPRGLVVVVSDLLTPDWRQALRRLPARGAEVLVVHVLAEEEFDPNLLGDMALVDTESGEKVPVSLTDEKVKRHTDRVIAWCDEVATSVVSAGGRYLRVMAHDDVEALLVSTWRSAGVVR